jgi:hypothetical protein
VTYEEKKKEIKRLAGNVDLITENLSARDNICWLITELEKAWSALEFIRNELGVPQPGYPAPVANAAERARKALEE